jgi:hypothetical protein
MRLFLRDRFSTCSSPFSKRHAGTRRCHRSIMRLSSLFTIIRRAVRDHGHRSTIKCRMMKVVLMIRRRVLTVTFSMRRTMRHTRWVAIVDHTWVGRGCFAACGALVPWGSCLRVARFLIPISPVGIHPWMIYMQVR